MSSWKQSRAAKQSTWAEVLPSAELHRAIFQERITVSSNSNNTLSLDPGQKFTFFFSRGLRFSNLYKCPHSLNYSSHLTQDQLQLVHWLLVEFGVTHNNTTQFGKGIVRDLFRETHGSIPIFQTNVRSPSKWFSRTLCTIGYFTMTLPKY